jgi:hypothetical protein
MSDVHMPSEGQVGRESGGGEQQQQEELPLQGREEDDLILEKTEAFLSLKELERDGRLSATEALEYRRRYKVLRQTLVQVQDKGRAAARDAQSLHSKRLGVMVQLEKGELTQAKLMTRIEKLELRRDAVKADLADLEQSDTVLKYDVAELQSSRDDLRNQLEDLEAENERIVQPELVRLRQMRGDTERELEREGESTLRDRRTIEELKDLIEQRKGEKEELARSTMAAKAALVKAKAEPIRIRKQRECIEKTSAALRAEADKVMQRDKETTSELERLVAQQAEADLMQKSLTGKLELHKDTMVHRQNDVDAVQQTLDLARERSHALRTDKVEAELRKRQADEDLRHERDSLSRTRKDFDVLKRTLKKKQGIVAAARKLIPALEEQVRDAQATAAAAAGRSAEIAKEVETLKQDVDIGIARFLRQEGVEEEQRDELQFLVEAVEATEAELNLWAQEERKQAKIVSLLTSQRELKAAESVRAASSAKEARERVRMKSLATNDLQRQLQGLGVQLKELNSLYDVVKNERNTYASLIQTSGQALAEMKEKLKILQNELVILRSESGAKEKALEKERAAHVQSQAQRDALRSEANRAAAEYRAKQTSIRQQITEIEKLNCNINNLEKAMLQLKTRYEAAVQARNLTGVQLIDRNDEMCVLYEKANLQEAALVKGELGIQAAEEQSRMIGLELAEIVRQKEAARRRAPDLSGREKALAELEAELAEEREVVEQLSRDLEDPANTLRWRAIEGFDPPNDELDSRAAELEARLGRTKEQLLEKELQLEEVTEITKELSERASKGREKARALAAKVNDAQSRVREATRRMMATVSELSMYQATVMKLQEEKARCEEEVRIGRARLAQGEPPSEDALIELDRRRRREMAAAANLTARYDEEMAAEAGFMQTTAEPRPNAYIPDELGIPKPYGALAPFKPQEPGSTMRHIRAPIPLEIEI